MNAPLLQRCHCGLTTGTCSCACPGSKPLPPTYLSGPMSGIPDFNHPAFHSAAAKLRAAGYTIVNPAELDALDAGKEMRWSEFLRRDIRALMDCENIVMLPGWEKSKGAKLEKHIAEQLGMRVIYIDHFTNLIAKPELPTPYR